MILTLVFCASTLWAESPGLPVPSLDKAKVVAQQASEKALVNLNTASEQDIAKLPGLSPQTAKEIVAQRPYKGLSDLKKVKGLKDDVLAKLKPLVSFQ